MLKPPPGSRCRSPTPTQTAADAATADVPTQAEPARVDDLLTQIRGAAATIRFDLPPQR